MLLKLATIAQMENDPHEPLRRAVDDYTLQLGRPLYWHSGAARGDIVGASCFIMKFADRLVGVTADHVIALFLNAKQQNPKLICQMSDAVVDLEERLIDRNEELDIATFSVDQKILNDSRAVTIDVTDCWPPPKVEIRDTLTLTGFPESLRKMPAIGHCEFGAWGAMPTVEDVTERQLIVVFDPTRDKVRGESRMPPLGFNMSGCSGGPALLHKPVNGLLRWFPVGMMSASPSEKQLGIFEDIDIIRINRIHMLRPDGTVGS
ncbi:MAG: hypothetical protein JSR60_09830 [Proteobacteria bacterium]|nr:hypothetical protein [Pseudomonadota bacterium]